MRVIVLSILLTTTILSGCATNGVNSPDVSFKKPLNPTKGVMRLQVEEQEQSFFASKRPKLGIALSGGGLRASSFSYGALKKLYDEGVLQNVDILSTVSGGGYTGYHLITTELKDTQFTGFGGAVFDESVFSQKIYEQYVKANFVPYSKILKSAVSAKTSFVDMYEDSMYRTYGVNASKDQKITGVKPLVASGQIPYFVVNTTVIKPEPKYIEEEPFEFTPIVSGSATRGFYTYEKGSDQSMLKLYAISGAAFKPILKQDISVSTDENLTRPLNVSGSTSVSTDTQSDGGHSENLGALALIRRGTETVIIIDAEHDPNYIFEGYQKLKIRLANYNSTFAIPKIEKIIEDSAQGLKRRTALMQLGRVESPVYYTEVKSKTPAGKEVTSNIIYIKMINSKLVDARIARLDQNKGYVENIIVRNILESTGNRARWWHWNKVWYPRVLAPYKIDFDNLFAYHVGKYPETLSRSKNAKIANLVPWSFTKVDFPQYSTGDQSFYNDQFLAFVGLGYFSAVDIKLSND